MAIRSTRPSRIDVLLARPIDGGWPAAILQLLLATSLLWIALGLALTLRESRSARRLAETHAWAPRNSVLRQIIPRRALES